MTRATIVWTEEARDKFREYADYIATNSYSKKIAQKWIKLVLKSIKKLKSFPESGPVYHRFKDIFPEKTRYLIVGSYNIIYQFDRGSNRVIILTIHHASQEDSLYKNR